MGGGGGAAATAAAHCSADAANCATYDAILTQTMLPMCFSLGCCCCVCCSCWCPCDSQYVVDWCQHCQGMVAMAMVTVLICHSDYDYVAVALA
eukprot:1065249-Lingulodinium_polyedra.AAC.1